MAKINCLLLVALQVLLVHLAMETTLAKPMDREYIDPLQLSTFKGYKYDYSLGSDGTYEFYYSLPTSSRREHRNEDGEVKGSYSFVAPEGDEYDFKYEADKEGFRVESNALPLSPKDTDEVRKAKEEFFEAYKKALELVSSSEDDDDDDSDEESDESYESSEEDDDYEESSEESSEEDDDSDEDEEEEEDENKGGEAEARGKQFFASSKSESRRKEKKPFFASRSPFKKMVSKKRLDVDSSFKRPVFVSSFPPKRLTARQSASSYRVPSKKSYFYAK